MASFDEILNDLIALRVSSGKSQRTVAKACGVSSNKIQRLEARELKRQTMEVDFVEKWLIECGSSMAEYFGARATIEERKVLGRDKELAELFRRALVHPEKRKLLSAYLDVLFPDEQPSDEVPR